MLESISDIVSKSAAAILTVMGLVAIPVQVADWLNSPKAGWVTAAGMTAFLGVPAFRVLPPTRVQRRFGIRRYKTQPIMASSVEKVAINSDFTAVIETTQTLIFREPPAPQDLVDLIDVLPTDTIEEHSYSTPDADVIDIVRKSQSTLAITWRPHAPIVPFVPHQHRTRYQTPSVYGDDGFYQAMYVDRDTGLKGWEFQSSHPIERAIGFKMPRVGARVTEPYLYRRFLRGDARGCEQPSIDEARTRMRWVLKNPEKGRSYVLFAVYKGMLPRVLERGDSLRLSRRTGAALATLRRRLIKARALTSACSRRRLVRS